MIIIATVCVGLLTNPVKNGNAMVNDSPNPTTTPYSNNLAANYEQEENKSEGTINTPEEIPEINDTDQNNNENTDKNRNQPIENDIAEYISYDYVDRSIYIAGLKIFEEFSTEEFGYSNEGNCSIIENENTLRFGITTATGSITGTLDGYTVYFKMDLDTNKIIEKEFGPAPDYDELGMTEFKQYSGMTIELSDERMAEIGVYFKEYILKIEAGGFLPGEMN